MGLAIAITATCVPLFIIGVLILIFTGKKGINP